MLIELTEVVFAYFGVKVVIVAKSKAGNTLTDLC